MTAMRYGAGAEANTPVNTITNLLGTGTANGTITLSDSLANYQFVAIATYFGDAYSTFDIIPVGYFKSPLMPFYIRLDTNNTYRHIQVSYASDTSVTITNRTSLNVHIIGVKLGGA